MNFIATVVCCSTSFRSAIISFDAMHTTKKGLYYHLLFRLWTQREVSNEELNFAYDTISSNLPPLYANLIARIADPSGRRRKKAAVILMDSIKIRVVKSSNRVRQNRTHYAPKGGQFVTETHGTFLDGTVCFVSCLATSSSPSMGDSMIILHMLRQDMEAEKAGRPLPHGLIRLLGGSDEYFVILVNWNTAMFSKLNM